MNIVSTCEVRTGLSKGVHQGLRPRKTARDANPSKACLALPRGEDALAKDTAFGSRCCDLQDLRGAQPSVARFHQMCHESPPTTHIPWLRACTGPPGDIIWGLGTGAWCTCRQYSHSKLIHYLSTLCLPLQPLVHMHLKDGSPRMRLQPSLRACRFTVSSVGNVRDGWSRWCLPHRLSIVRAGTSLFLDPFLADCSLATQCPFSFFLSHLKHPPMTPFAT